MPKTERKSTDTKDLQAENAAKIMMKVMSRQAFKDFYDNVFDDWIQDSGDRGGEGPEEKDVCAELQRLIRREIG